MQNQGILLTVLPNVGNWTINKQAPPQQPQEERGRRRTERTYKGRRDDTPEGRRQAYKESIEEKRRATSSRIRSQRRAEEAQRFRQARRRNQPLQDEEHRGQFYEPFMREAEIREMVRNPNNPDEEQGQVYAMDRNYQRKRLKRGRGLMSGDEMIERFYLLSQSMNAGNESDEMLNEMMDLLDALLQNQYITQSQHKTLYHNYINVSIYKIYERQRDARYLKRNLEIRV